MKYYVTLVLFENLIFLQKSITGFFRNKTYPYVLILCKECHPDIDKNFFRFPFKMIVK